jgi:hypothetical protein
MFPEKIFRLSEKLWYVRKIFLTPKMVHGAGGKVAQKNF